MDNLTLLTGQVNNLKVERATKDFFKSKVSQKVAEVGALGAAALGTLAASTALANYRLNANDNVEHFTCTVNGVNLAGCFETVTFMEHNDIEFVVEYTNEDKTEALVHGARDHKKRIMWVVPYQQYGHIAHKRARNKDAKQISIGFSIFFLFIIFIGELIGERAFDLMFLYICVLGPLIGGLVVYLLVCFSYRKTFPHSKRGTKVFEAMGYEKPAEVNLMSDHFEADEKWGKENGGKYGRIPHLWVYRF